MNTKDDQALANILQHIEGLNTAIERRKRRESLVLPEDPQIAKAPAPAPLPLSPFRPKPSRPTPLGPGPVTSPRITPFSNTTRSTPTPFAAQNAPMANTITQHGHIRPENPKHPDKHAFAWERNPYGINVSALLSIAEGQLNTKEGSNNDNPYGDWYIDPNTEWCAQYASWCANEVGSLNTDITKNTNGIPKNESTSHFIQDYTKMGRFADAKANTNSYKPKAGDFIFLQWFKKDKNGKKVLQGHTGIVVAYFKDPKTGTEYVYTIEGNSRGNKGGPSNGVYYHCRTLTDSDISGYGINGGTSDGTVPDLSKNSE